jgi:hypothetical protein
MLILLARSIQIISWFHGVFVWRVKSYIFIITCLVNFLSRYEFFHIFTAANNASERAANKAGAYGGSEVGSIIGEIHIFFVFSDFAKQSLKPYFHNHPPHQI